MATKAAPGAEERKDGSWHWPSLGVLVLGAVLALQLGCVLFFVYDIFGGHLGLRDRPISWIAHELFQLGAIVGLMLGVVVSGAAILRANRRARDAEDRLADLSRAFHELMEERFAAWSLTPAERDVASFVMKGFSTNEIAGLRETSEGTVKAQTAAIYRKAGVSGRAQLVSLFLEDLMDENLGGQN